MRFLSELVGIDLTQYQFACACVVTIMSLREVEIINMLLTQAVLVITDLKVLHAVIQTRVLKRCAHINM